MHGKQGLVVRNDVFVETAFCRYKKILGQHLYTHKLANQRAELHLGAKILNMTTHLGMLDSYKV